MTKVHYDPNQPTSFVLVQVHDIQTYIDYHKRQEWIPFEDRIRYPPIIKKNDTHSIDEWQFKQHIPCFYTTATSALRHSYHGSYVIAEVRTGCAWEWSREPVINPYNRFKVEGVYEVYPAVNNQSFILAEQYLEQSPLRTLRYNPEEMSATIYLRHLAYLATAPEIFMPSYALGYLDYRDTDRVHDACSRMKRSVEHYEFAHASIESRRISRHPYLPPYVQHYGLELFKYMMDITSTQENVKRDPVGDDRENWIPLKNSYKDSLYEATYDAMISYFGGIA